MALIRANYKRIKNLGSYENVTVDIGIEMECPEVDGNPAEAAEQALALWKWLELKGEAALDKYRGKVSPHQK